ncbi:hypothetical protein D3C77_512560 [compost metagenome]
MLHRHAPLEFSRNNAQEGNSIPVRRIHIGLDFEYITRELFMSRLNHSRQTMPRLRLRSKAQEVLQKRLNAKIIYSTAEEDRSELAAAYLFHIERIARHIEELQILTELIMKKFPSQLTDRRVMIVLHLLHLNLGMIVPLEQFNLIIHPVINAR